MTFDEYWSMKYFEKQQEKRPSARLQKANEMWQSGYMMREIMQETDLWTHLPDALLFMQRGNTFYVDGEEYHIDRFDYYDNIIVEDSHGNESYHNVYGSRGDDFFNKVELQKPEKKLVKEETEDRAGKSESR